MSCSGHSLASGPDLHMVTASGNIKFPVAARMTRSAQAGYEIMTPMWDPDLARLSIHDRPSALQSLQANGGAADHQMQVPGWSVACHSTQLLHSLLAAECLLQTIPHNHQPAGSIPPASADLTRTLMPFQVLTCARYMLSLHGSLAGMKYLHCSAVGARPFYDVISFSTAVRFLP